MRTDHPFIDMDEAYKNRARIEKARLTENIRLRHDGLSEFAEPHYPIRVKKSNYQHRQPKKEVPVRSQYQRAAAVFFEPSEILPFINTRD